MFGTDYFQIIHGEFFTIGELVPSGLAVSGDKFERGTAMDRNGVANVCVLGEGDYVGFLTKKFTFDGPDFQSMTLGDPDLPAKAGQAATLAVLPAGGELEVEGEPSKASTAASLGLLVTSGTGAISNATAIETDLSIKDGRWRVAQTGDRVCGTLKAQLTPIVDAVNNIRILISLKRGQIK